MNCAKRVLQALRSDGVVVWDNSDREKYEDGYAFLKGHGFRQIDFEGIGPVNIDPWSTSIFYRDNNCLGL